MREMTTNRYMHLIGAFACAVVLAMAMMMASTCGQAHAYSVAQPLTSGKPMAVSVGKGQADIALYSPSHSSKKARNVKVSNKSIASVKVLEGYTVVHMKKAGTVKVSYRWAKKNYTVTIRGYKYENPVKSFKVAGKEYRSKFAKVRFGNAGKKLAGKVQITPAKNWKLVEIWDDNRVKNGGKISGYVQVCLYNTKTKVTQWIGLDGK